MTALSNIESSELESLSHVYTLLARLWLREVDAPLLAEISKPSLRDALAAIGVLVPHADAIDDLSVEYCGWFVGPKNHLPPLQSVWHHGQLQSDASDSMRTFMEVFRFKSSTSAGEMPDHLGVQLELMGHAVSIVARTNSTIENQQAIGEFFRRHLTWPDRLFAALLARNDSPFYHSVVQATSNFLSSEADAWVNS